MRGAAQYDVHIRHALLKLKSKTSTISSLLIRCSQTLLEGAGQHRLIALTNNFARIDVLPEEAAFLGWEDGPTPNHLRALFDDLCDSSSLGMRWVQIFHSAESVRHEIT